MCRLAYICFLHKYNYLLINDLMGWMLEMDFFRMNFLGGNKVGDRPPDILVGRQARKN